MKKNMKGRKAYVLQDPIVIIILAAIVLFALVVLAIKFNGMMKDYSAKEECQKSLELSTIKLEGLADKFGNPVRINCKTDYLKYSTQEDEEIEEVIANKMVECWDMYLQGKKEIFDTEDNNYCVVCSRLEFEKKTEISGFTEYLNSRNAPLKDETYLEYLSGVHIIDYKETDTEEESGNSSGFDAIDSLSTKEPLAVMFTMSKNANPTAALGVEGTKVISTTSGAGIGAGAGILSSIIIAGIVACPETAGAGCVVAGVLSTVAGYTVAGGIAGAGIGYAVGSSRTADWDAKIVVWPYDRLGELDCTYLEAESAPLQVKEMDNDNS